MTTNKQPDLTTVDGIVEHINSKMRCTFTALPWFEGWEAALDRIVSDIKAANKPAPQYYVRKRGSIYYVFDREDWSGGPAVAGSDYEENAQRIADLLNKDDETNDRSN